MAIIYNYPLNSILLAEDMLIGTSTNIVNGQPKNATKNFSIADLTGFIKQNVSLNDVLLVGNTSLLDAKVGRLYLYDTPVTDYGNIVLNQNRFSFNTVTHGEVFRAQRDMFSSFSSSGYRGSFEVSSITANRVWDFPNKSGTVALLSDVPVGTTPTLQEVTDEGNTTTNNITCTGIINGTTIVCEDGYIDSAASALFVRTVTGGEIGLTTNIGGEYTFPDASGIIALTSDITPQVNSDWNATSGVTQILNKPGLSTVYQNEIHISKDGSDVTGDGTLLNPFASITQGLTLVAGTRKTIVVHPGSYSESPNITVQYTVLTTFELLGGNTEIVGTVSINKGCTISGVKMNNLTITAPTGTGNVNILNCEVNGTLTKSSTADYTLIRFCDLASANITGSGLVAMFGGNPNFTTVNNAAARVIVKSAVTVSPVLTAGSLSLVDSIVVAAVTNAFTSAAGTFTTLANSQFLTSALNNVAPVVLNGFYSILNCVFNKPTSTLVALSGTGGSTNSIVYSQFINADKFIKQGGTSAEYLMADGSVTTGGSSPLTTKGDLYTYSTVDARLPVGLDTQVLLADSTTATGLKWGTNTAAAPLGYYGAFSDVTDQFATVINTGYPMLLGITDLSNGVTVVSGSRITIANTGIYNIQWSGQFRNPTANEHDVTIWLRKNGVDVPGSSGVVLVPKKHGSFDGHTLPSWNFLVDPIAGDYYEFVWSTQDLAVFLSFQPAGSPPPSTASVVLTVTQQSGIMAGTGITAINSLTGSVQTMVVGTGAANLNIVSSGSTHTFNLLFNIRRNANNSSNNNINYNGYAPNGSAEASAVWIITRLTISGSGAITVGTATNVAWINRESATYI